MRPITHEKLFMTAMKSSCVLIIDSSCSTYAGNQIARRASNLLASPSCTFPSVRRARGPFALDLEREQWLEGCWRRCGGGGIFAERCGLLVEDLWFLRSVAWSCISAHRSQAIFKAPDGCALSDSLLTIDPIPSPEPSPPPEPSPSGG